MTTRREFIKSAAAAAAAVGVPGLVARGAHAHGAERLRVGLIGCGGRGTGAAADALSASPYAEVTAMADVFADRLSGSLAGLRGLDPTLADRVKVSEDRCFVGFDAYRDLLALRDVDLVILATPPHFRPMHFEAAIAAGKHVFMEKPVAVDGPGIRRVLASGVIADEKRLCVVAGTQRRHERCYLETLARLGDGAIGRIVTARCYWNQGGLWKHDRQPQWTDMEWQLRNWLYFAWLSGDHIVEQHVHNLDVCNWAIGAHPLRCMGMGGRQVRTDPAYGHVFDHFAIEYEYPGGVTMTSMCRQIAGCADRVEEVITGTNGASVTSSGRAAISGAHAWTFQGENPTPYVREHADLASAISSGTRLNEARNVAEATLTAIMGRMSAYTGKEVTWEQALNSAEDLSPAAYEFGSLAVPPVAVPGRTPLA